MTTAKLAVAVGASPWESQVFLDGHVAERLTAIHFVAEPMTAVHVHLTYFGYPGVRDGVVDALTIQHAADFVIEIGEDALCSGVYYKGASVEGISLVSVDIDGKERENRVRLKFLQEHADPAVIAELGAIPWITVEVDDNELGDAAAARLQERVREEPHG